MAYKVYKKELCSVVDEFSYYRYEIMVDTSDDLPEPGEDWSPLSVALIANERTVKILNNKKEWV